MTLANKLRDILNSFFQQTLRRQQNSDFFDNADITFDEYIVLIQDQNWTDGNLRLLLLQSSAQNALKDLPNKIIEFLAKRSALIKSSIADYPAFPLTPMNEMCLLLAQAFIEENKIPLSLKYVLMPDGVKAAEYEYISQPIQTTVEDLNSNIKEFGDNAVVFYFEQALLRAKSTDIFLTYDNNGLTPLLCAAKYGAPAVIKKILRWGNPALLKQRTIDGTGRGAAHLAARYGHINVLEYLQEEMGRQKLHDALDNNWNTLQHEAAKAGQTKVIQWLGLTKRLSTNLKSQTPLQSIASEAVLSGHAQAAEALMDIPAVLDDANVTRDALNTAITNKHSALALAILKKGPYFNNVEVELAFYNQQIVVLVAMSQFACIKNADQNHLLDNILKLLMQFSSQYIPEQDFVKGIRNLIIQGAVFNDSKTALFIKNHGGLKFSELRQHKYLNKLLHEITLDSLCSLLPIEEQNPDNYLILYAQAFMLEMLKKCRNFHYNRIFPVIEELTPDENEITLQRKTELLNILQINIMEVQQNYNPKYSSYIFTDYEHDLRPVFASLPDSIAPKSMKSNTLRI